MIQKMTWDEMKEQFPNEWLLITDYETDDRGNVLNGVVERHSSKTDEVYRPPALKKRAAFRYTGKDTFPGGWRAHAEHHHV